MRKYTDLDEVKKIAISFLYLDIKETPYSPAIIQHPIFDSGFIHTKDKILNILDDGLDEAIEYYKEKILSISNLDKILYTIIRKPYYLTFLKYIKNALSNEDFSRILAICWTTEETPNDDINVPVSLAIKWFKASNKQHLMDTDEFKYFLNLPDTFIVYRGVTPGHNPNGLSWTQDLDKAKWFSNRFGNGYVREGLANKEDVLAYFNRRDEEEIIISPETLQNKIIL